MIYGELDCETPKKALAKHKYFQGETEGNSELATDLVRLSILLEETGGGVADEDEDADICLPEKLLQLAKQV